MAREDLHFRLRIPEDLKTAIEAEAEKNRRSMTAEIVERLENSLKGYFVGEDEFSDVETRFEELVKSSKEMIQELREATQRERELGERIMSLVDALAQSNETNARLIAMVEEKFDVGQKA